MRKTFICSMFGHRLSGPKHMREHTFEPQNGYVTKVLSYEQRCARCGKYLIFEVASFVVRAPAPSPY